ncbi:MAG: histidinol dehydrogenase [Patescibacteria group bacterium]
MNSSETGKTAGQEGLGITSLIKIYRLSEMTDAQKKTILNRSSVDIAGIKQEILPIINDVRARGDQAILEYLKQFDKVELTQKGLVVSKKDIDEAYKNTGAEVLEAIRKQITLSKLFHQAQSANVKKQWSREIAPGVKLGQKKTPIESVGLYVPGGTASYPTVMQILAVPAKIAGVERIVGVVSPTRKNYEVIVAAKESGVDELYRVSGVTAIAALAYGTETIKAVDKIVGPGNKYVTAAKIEVSGDVGIDMPAGPSEVLILADKDADPVFCAADILSAAEHDPNAAGILVTWDEELAQKTQKEITRQTQFLKRQDIIKQALARYSAIIVVKNKKEAVDFANEFAPEHLEIMTQKPEELAKKINNAGSIFLGKWTSKALGDYATGANHVLPTARGARIFSPIGVETFMKTSQIQQVTKEGLRNLSHIMESIVKVEGLDAHWNSVKQRLRK